MLNDELKKNPFAIPDSYFENLPSKVQDRYIAAKKSPKYGFIPRLVWAGGVAVLVLALFLSYFSNSIFNTQQKTDIQTVDVGPIDNFTEPVSAQENYLKQNRNAVANYLAAKNVSIYDYLASKY
ncbi:MAG: hypothetical protein LBT24_04785 [Tannerella sp.]|nr:hypothetical protein [Tannerella sp.]